jgi:hypothetical protein
MEFVSKVGMAECPHRFNATTHSSSLRTQQAREATQDGHENPPRDEDHREAQPDGDCRHQDDKTEREPKRPPAGVEAFHAALPDRPVDPAARLPRFLTGRTRLHGDAIDLDDLHLDDLFLPAHAVTLAELPEIQTRNPGTKKQSD